MDLGLMPNPDCQRPEKGYFTIRPVPCSPNETKGASFKVSTELDDHLGYWPSRSIQLRKLPMTRSRNIGDCIRDQILALSVTQVLPYKVQGGVDVGATSRGFKCYGGGFPREAHTVNELILGNSGTFLRGCPLVLVV